MAGDAWGHHKAIKIIRLNKSPQCEEGSTLINGVNLKVLSQRDPLEAKYLTVVCICFFFHTILVLIEPRWTKLRNCTVCLLRHSSEWWPGFSAVFNITVFVLYVLLIQVCLTDQHMMSRVICVPEGDTHFNQVTTSILTAELMQ